MRGAFEISFVDFTSFRLIIVMSSNLYSTFLYKIIPFIIIYHLYLYIHTFGYIFSSSLLSRLSMYVYSIYVVRSLHDPHVVSHKDLESDFY